jgi:NTE family protein
MLRKLTRTLRAFGRELRLFSTAPAPSRTPSIGLALGGGFARGMAHIGVLKVFEEEKIPINFVAGTSVGALIGAAYCSGITVAELEEIAARVRFRDFARWTLSRYGFYTNERMTGFLSKTLKARTFEELRIPLAVAATDFSTGEAVVFDSGPLIDPVRASCAYPGMFLPVSIGGRLLVDGLLGHAVPTIPLRQMGAERVVAIYLSGGWVNPEGPRHVFEIVGQCFSIAQAKMSSLWQKAADLVIQPDVNGFGYDAFDHAPELIRVGEAAARAALPELRRWLPPAASQAAKRAGVRPAPAQPSPA